MARVLTAFTDGSCVPNPGRGGWATVFVLDSCLSVIKGRAEKATNNSMESTAVLEAIRWAVEQNYDEIVINTDSTYVCTVFDNLQRNLAKKAKLPNYEVWRQVSELRPKIKITFKWVRGHSHDTYNEMADRYANQARDE